MNGLLINEKPCYHILIACTDLIDDDTGEPYYDYITTTGIVDNGVRIKNGERMTFTINENEAIWFADFDNALEWCKNYLDEFKRKFEKICPGMYDWDDVAIVERKYKVTPLKNVK